MSTIRWMRQATQAEEIALQVAEDEHFFVNQSPESVEKDKFVTDMISSVDGELAFEGMTTSPIVDQILAYAKECKPISDKMHFILTMIRSTSIFTRILRCREPEVSAVWLSEFLFSSLLSKCGATVGVDGRSTPSVELRSLQSSS